MAASQPERIWSFEGLFGFELLREQGPRLSGQPHHSRGEKGPRWQIFLTNCGYQVAFFGRVVHPLNALCIYSVGSPKCFYYLVL
jgi:hypothetical protein